MKIDTAFFHDVCINILYGSMVVLTFVIVERLVYYALLAHRNGKLGAAIRGSNQRSSERTFKRRDLLTRGLAEYIELQNEPAVTRDRIEDASSALFMEVNGRIEARIWLLDTIVTSAPLLGLLGTILGIMDTFSALSSGGISDPAAVSRGIAAALVATAIGIGTALYALLGLNLLRRIADHLGESFKGLILASHSLGSRGIKLASNTARPNTTAIGDTATVQV